MRLRSVAALGLGLAVVASGQGAEALRLFPRNRPDCAPAGSEGAAVKTVRDLFTATRIEDEVGFRELTTRDFYAFDGGRRFVGLGLFDIIKTAHRAGRRYEWSVNEPDVRLACDYAHVAYVNRGAVEEAGVRTPLTWLESVLLHYEGGRWRITFLHSTRATPLPTPSPPVASH